jgi:CHAT domain
VPALEITLQRRTDDGWPVVAEWTSADGYPAREEGLLRLALERLTTEGNPRSYGATLGEALWGVVKVRLLFERALEKADDRLHVFLVVEAPDLKTLRWERLCTPGDRDANFLVLDQRTPFSLYIPSSIAGDFPPIGRADLRALVCVSSPEGLERFGLSEFDVPGTVQTIRRSLGHIPCDVLAGVDGAVGPSTLNALCERLTATPYSILHLVCHGSFGGEGDTSVFLADEANQIDRIQATLMLQRLKSLGGKGGLPRLAFLGTCMSAAPEAEGVLGGLAQGLVRQLGIPAVVAMTDRVLLDTTEALTSTFYQRLWEHGLVDLALTEAYAGLDPRKHSIAVPTLFSRLGGRPLFSDTLDRELSPEETKLGLDRLEELLADRGPVLLDTFRSLAAEVRRTLPMDTASLPPSAQTERDRALEQISRICAEVLEPLDFHGLSLGHNPPNYEDEEPFRGLYPFRTEDQKFFCGREELVEQLVQRLTQHNFLAVLGPSGSGKSSVVLAGLVPALRRQEAGMEVQYMTPGADPSAHLSVALDGSVPGSMLIVDQFEELFTLTAANERPQFIPQLLEAIEKRRVVLAMRADFWGECAPYHELKGLMQQHQELIAPMDTAELRRAIDMQAGKALLKFEGDLASTILEEVQGEPGAMPLLQHALRELWKRRHGRWLRSDEYNALGRVRGAISHSADELFEMLSDDECERVQGIFLRLTRLDVSGTEGAWRDTRQRVSMEELVPAGTDPSATKDLVKRLADARLVVTGETAGVDHVEVAHEALIQHWPRLRSWIDEDRTTLRARAELREAARGWIANAKDDAFLVHRGTRLASMEVIAERPRLPLTVTERSYLDACIQLRAREKAREEGLRRRNLADTGWAVIFAKDGDPAIREALRPLLNHRRALAAQTEENRYRELFGEDGYQVGESKAQFLARHGAGKTGPPDPDRMPYYILIVGDPTTIPYSFQTALDVQYAVGRIHFATADEYANYARSVVAAETAGRTLPKRAVLFGVRNKDDPAMRASSENLVAPLAAILKEARPDWQVHLILGEEATKLTLSQIVGGSQTPAFLFAVAHGIGFPSGDERQEAHNGAIVCGDWPGPLEWRKPIPPDFYYSADDVPETAPPFGTFVFSFGSYTAGTPEFEAVAFSDDEPRRLAARPFVARLPQRLLGHPKGGALGFVGQLERGWGFSFMDPGVGRNLGAFSGALRSLWDGHPIGSAMETFNQRYAELAAELLVASESGADPKEIDQLSIAAKDTRDYAIVGDPAVHLMVDL